MSQKWYYVFENEKKGPIEKNELLSLKKENKIYKNTYVWTKGFENWIHYSNVLELATTEQDQKEQKLPKKLDSVPAKIKKKEFDWSNFDKTKKKFFIKIGVDRNEDEKEFGPYSFEIITKLAKEDRINKQTYIYTSGMDNWMFFGDTPIFLDLCPNVDPSISEKNRRKFLRKPFVAHMFFHDEKGFSEGLCKDISLGGLQIISTGFDLHTGDIISINVHPESEDEAFMAKCEVRRIFDDDSGFALKFVQLDGKAKKTIEEYLNNN